MSRFVFKLPDLGEGTVEAEIVSWHVKPGDEVSEDDVLVEVMTEKAAVEVPAPVSGKIVSTTGQPGDMVAVGAELVVLETDAAGATAGGASAAAASAPAARAAAGPASGMVPSPAPAANGGGAARGEPPAERGIRGANGHGAARQAPAAAGVPGNGGALGVGPGGSASAAAPDPNRRVLTSPAIRRRAKEAGIDL
ncbi:MAG TPA: biotin/lipoyl-containing protein, partial [Steroidobacteraceae bacterium]|nr:biotin/lipoyl-containing protein [Steroidobacteraceae bacterium]